jgi:cytochrome b pre-mRNA-processing protein 3
MIWPFTRRPALADAHPLYNALIEEARRPRWYEEAGAEDSIDGRFAVLATMVALADIRLGKGGDIAAALAPRLTEIFVDDMDAQLRQEGIGDPTLGKQVKKMVGALAARIERLGGTDDGRWRDAVRQSIHVEAAVDGAALDKTGHFASEFRERLAAASDEALARGEIG